MDTVAEKRCSKCGECKPLDSFYVKDKRTGRLFSWCSDCHRAIMQARYYRDLDAARARERAYSAAWAAANTERTREINQASRSRNRDEINRKAREHRQRPEVQEQRRRYKQTPEARARQAAYREAHREELREQGRLYREKVGKDLLLKRTRDSQARHPDRLKASAQRWKATNKDTVNASTHRRRARIKGNGGTWTAAEWAAIKAAQDHRCLMCGRAEPEITLTVDHIVPVSAGGPNVASNLQGLCKSCNSKKHRQTLDLRIPQEV